MEAIFSVLTKPLKLKSQETSKLLPLFEENGHGEMFARVIALFRDNEPLGGEAPTFQIRSGMPGHLITSVGVDQGDFEIPPPPNWEGRWATTASCKREDNDIFLIKITDIAENSGLWSLRFRNNDPEELVFCGFSALTEKDTAQPFVNIVLEGVQDLDYSSVQSIFKVRNWGTAPLTIRDEIGPIGTRDDDPIEIKEIIHEVLPHWFGLIKITHRRMLDSWQSQKYTFSHRLNTNDTKNDVALYLYRVPPAKGKDGGKDGLDNGPGKTRPDRKSLELGSFQASGMQKNVTDRLAGLEYAFDRLAHFIGPELRPDLSRSALADEEDMRESEVQDLSDKLRMQVAEAKGAKEAFDNKRSER